MPPNVVKSYPFLVQIYSIISFLSAKLYLRGKNIPSSVFSFNFRISRTFGFYNNFLITFYFEIIVIALFYILAVETGKVHIFFAYFFNYWTLFSIYSWFSNFTMRITVDSNKFLSIFLTATKSLCLTPIQSIFNWL